MEAIELFFATYEKTAWAFFSMTGFLFICYRVYKGHKEEIQKTERLEQRKEFQAEFFDLNIKDYKELQAKYEVLLVKVAVLEAKN